MTSTIKKLDTDIQIPYDEEALRSNNPVRIAEYMLELVRTLQEFLERVAEVANYGVDAFDGEALYLGLKNSSGEYPIGTWRLIKVDSSLQIQEKVTDTGVVADDWKKVASHSR